jgi:hypothetical protein
MLLVTYYIHILYSPMLSISGQMPLGRRAAVHTPMWETPGPYLLSRRGGLPGVVFGPGTLVHQQRHTHGPSPGHGLPLAHEPPLLTCKR